MYPILEYLRMGRVDPLIAINMKKVFLVVLASFLTIFSKPLLAQGNDCSSAVALDVTIGSCNFITTSNSGFTNSGQVPVGASCEFFSGGDIWYSIQVPPSGQVTISTSSILGVTPATMNMNAAAYSGSCGALSLIACDDNSGPGFFPELTLDETPGSTVFVQLWETNNNVQGDFSICANGATTCTSPTLIFSQETCLGNNQYEVSLFISSLGDAPSIDIINDGDASSILGVTAPGVQNVGPFSLDQQPTITLVHNADNTCNVVSQASAQGLGCENIITCGETLNETYCYQNDDNSTFLYSSPDNEPVVITFNSGTLENGNDFITVRDGDNASASVLFQGSNGGDLSGLSFTATSGSLFLSVSSDVSGSCQDGSFDFGSGWNWDVECQSCSPPEANFSIEDNCAEGTFMVNVNISSLGNSSTLSISNDAGVGATTGVNAVGVQSVGPFSIGMPVELTISSEDIADCSLVQGGLDFTCPSGENCDNATSILSQTTFNASQITANTNSVTYSFLNQCSGPGENPDPYFSFTAVATTHYFRVDPVGDFDAAIEVFNGCGGTQLACVNLEGAGQRELFWLNNLNIGQEYFYRVYHAGNSDPSSTSFNTAIAHIPLVELRPFDCGATGLISNSLIRATLPNPNFLLEGYTFEFTELEEPFATYEVESPNGSNPNFLIGWFQNFEYGRSYSVRVRARMFQGPNFGEYGNACTISLADAPSTFLLPQFENNFYDMCDFIKARRLVGSTNYRWVFDNGAQQFEYNSNSASVICPLQSVPGLLLGNTYSVTVFATDAQGNESTTSTSRQITMNNFVPNTEVNASLFGCGSTVPLSRVLSAVEVCAVTEYTFRFTNLTQTEEPIEVARPNRIIQLSFVPGLQAGNTYSVAVQASSGGLQGDFASECMLTIQPIENGIQGLQNLAFALDSDDNAELLIHPNPLHGTELNFSLNRSEWSGQLTAEVFDLQGKKVFSKEIDSSSMNFSFNLQNITTGMYFLQVSDQSRIISAEKIVVE